MLEEFTGTLEFGRPMGELGAEYVYDPSRSTLKRAPHAATIRDARPICSQLSLDRQGFMLVNHKAATTDPHQIAAHPQAYTDQMAAMLRELMGADKVVFQLHGLQVRFSDPAMGNNVKRPISIVHADYKREFALEWLKWEQMLRGEDYSGYSRFCVIQTWRSLGPPQSDNTLTICDASTIDKGKAVFYNMYAKEDLSQPASYWEMYTSQWDESQHWYYFSNLRADEVILFKGHDSDDAHYVQPLHCAVDLPPLPDLKPRASVEARFLVFFK
jgi:hypothetical protein